MTSDQVKRKRIAILSAESRVTAGLWVEDAGRTLRARNTPTKGLIRYGGGHIAYSWGSNSKHYCLTGGVRW